jgi:hypothetical protein
MNPDTLVSVHGYSGDSHQIRTFLPTYEHHECPVVILSPTDSPIDEMGPHICRTGGLRSYIGKLSIARQIKHLQILLEYPFKFYLLNDADSVCVSPNLPDYCYKEPQVVWSNEVSDMMHNRVRGYKYPRLAFQPPYFISRENIAAIVSASRKVIVDVQTPFIDWWMMAVVIKAGLSHKTYPHGISCPTFNYPPGIEWMRSSIRHHGAVMLHSLKSATEYNIMKEARAAYVAEVESQQ